MILRGLERKQAKENFKQQQLRTRLLQMEMDDPELRRERYLNNQFLIERGRGLRAANLMAEGTLDSGIKQAGSNATSSELAAKKAQFDLDMLNETKDMQKQEYANRLADQLSVTRNRDLTGSQNAAATETNRLDSENRRRMDLLKLELDKRELAGRESSDRQVRQAEALNARIAALTTAGSLAKDSRGQSNLMTLLGQTEMAGRLHPEASRTPEQRGLMARLGTGYDASGAVKSELLDQRVAAADALIRKSPNTRSKILEGITPFIEDIDASAEAYGGIENIPGYTPALGALRKRMAKYYNPQTTR